LKAQNSPIDIGEQQIKPYKDTIEELFSGYYYQNKKHALHELITGLDPEEKYIMNDLERSTYVALREGLQIFKAVYTLLADKIELKKRIIASSDSLNDPVIDAMRGFCGNFSAFGASVYIRKKLQLMLKYAGLEEQSEKLDLSQIQLHAGVPEDMLLKRLLVPVFVNLIRHKKEQSVFKTAYEFPVYCREVFQYYENLAKDAAVQYTRFDEQLSGYRFRIMDDFVALEAYRDVALSGPASGGKAAISFQRIRVEDIVGNRLAKTKIIRYIDRLALYDRQEQKNPIMALGGLSWTNLFDGPPGTGKSSMFRLAMTRLSDRAQALGVPFNIITVDQSIKDEFYGKTGKILLQRLEQTQDPAALSIVIFDDIDLLTSARGDAQGADNDINNIIMQYLDGVFTVRRGNVINFAASNKPTGLDSAMRNRFSDRLLVDGPVAAEDFADMFHIVAENMIKHRLIDIDDGYQPFQSQAGASANSGEQAAAYMADSLTQYKQASVLDFGKFMHSLKAQNELITGRSTKAIMDAVMERSADFDIPEEWFTNPGLYLEKPYAQKLGLLKALYRPITPDVLFQEAQRYFDSEQRYAQTEADEEITRAYNRRLWELQSQIRFYRQQLQAGEQGDQVQLQKLLDQMQTLLRSAG